MDGRRRRVRATLLTLGIVCIVASVTLIAVPLYGVWTRGRADSTALDAWNRGGSQDLIGAIPSAGSPAASPSSATGSSAGSSATQRTVPTCGSGAPGDYALVTFPSLARYGYAGVAGQGNWDRLKERSMVHYDASPAPGQQGNVIIAFHREPDFQHIDGLVAGDVVTVQDRACHSFSYRIARRWELEPSRVTQLENTTGHELTLITCTPWFQDQLRYVWRAELIS